MQEVPNNNHDQSQGQEKRNVASSGYGPHIIEPFTTTAAAATLKSNLKRSTTAVLEENNQSRITEKRKVSWPDAHGKDIAHVHEFEPSISEDGELEGVRNSCICTIQ